MGRRACVRPCAQADHAGRLDDAVRGYGTALQYLGLYLRVERDPQEAAKVGAYTRLPLGST
jgi:hypothetical protein